MKMNYLYLLAFIFCFEEAVAQTRPAQATQPQPTAQKPTFTNMSDSLKLAATDFKNSMNTLFGGKRDTIAFLIPDIEYDDSTLSKLKDELKKTKGVKFLGMQYKASAAKIDLSFKGKPTDLWDKLSPEIRQAFRIIEAGENFIALGQKTKSNE